MNDEFESLTEWPPFGLSRDDKRPRLERALSRLTALHAARCEPYGRILEARGIDPCRICRLDDVPMIPVRLFKHYELRSVPPEAVFKTLTSSGTTGQAPSRIALDKVTAQLQTATLIKIMQEFLGKARLPMLIVDHPGVIKDRRSFSARGAGILGLSNFGRGHVYALRDDMTLDLDAVEAFAQSHSGVPKLLFGFTFMVWQHLLLELERRGRHVDLSGSILIHSGGWKKLEALAVDNVEFKRRLRVATHIERIHNFYGMVEQVGSIFVECEHGHLHTPAFADVIIREAGTWTPLANGQAGIVQVLSCLPQSYPGHSLLTEDRGTILGEDDCPCGRKGRYFHIHGRLPKAEVRGCSDTQPSPESHAN
jgi:hypothetical protein